MTGNKIIKFSAEDSDDENKTSLQPKAFDIPPSPTDEDLSSPPMDGIQFLRRVMIEAKSCQGVVVAKYEKPQRNNQIPQLPVTKTCKGELLPTKEWQLTTMADFSKLRLKMDSLRQMAQNEPEFISIKKTLPQTEDEQEWLKVVQLGGPNGVGPSTRFCLSLPQHNLRNLLGLFGDWLTEGDVDVPVGCRWLYCLMACLELPVEPCVYYSMRHISRILINYRAGLESADSEELPHINLLVCIIGRYFSQTDLADPY